MDEKQERIKKARQERLQKAMKLMLNSSSEFVVGFFGWFLFSNIAFWVAVLLNRIHMPGFDFTAANRGLNLPNLIFWMFIFIWLPTILLMLSLFVKKKLWLVIGILAAVIFNSSFHLLPILPIPSGLLLLCC